MNRVPQRLLMLGLDGADLDFIRTRAEHLPTLNRALSSGPLFEPKAPEALSGSVWPTFYSGCHPGIHGMYQHLVWDAARMGLRRIGHDWCFYEPFWKELEQRGHRVVVMDVPYSFGTGLTQGVEITDWGTHGQTFPMRCNQPDVAARIRRFGRSPIGRETPVKKTPGQLSALCGNLKRAAAKKADLVRLLMKDLEWDLFITVFAETHRGGHLFYSEIDALPDGGTSPMLEVYRSIDTALADILKDAGPDTTAMIFSVHGMMRNPAQEHVVAPLMNRLNAAFLQDHCGRNSVKPRSRGGVVGALRKSVPARLQHAVGAAAPDGVRQWVVEREIIGGLDWQSTPGFALRTDIRTELRLNLIGREAKGFLEAGSRLHRCYIDFLRKSILNLTDADTGARLVDDMVDIQAQFPGPRSDRLPDYAITWRTEPAARRVHIPSLGSLTVNRPGVRGGDHTDFGFAILMPNGNGLPPDLPPLDTVADFAHFVGCLMENAVHMPSR